MKLPVTHSLTHLTLTKSNQIKFVCSNISHLHVGSSKISLWAGPTRL